MKKLIVIFVLLMIVSVIYAQQYGWRVIATPRPGYQMHVVTFKDTLHGWCEAGGLIYRTTDGGYSWVPTTGQKVANTAISMIDTLNGWATGSIQYEAEILHTTDGGSHWVQQVYSIALSDTQQQKQYKGVAAKSRLRASVSGISGRMFMADTGKLVETTNGGQLWIERSYVDSITYLGQIQFVDSIHGWVSGRVFDTFLGRAVFLRTSDGGSTWQFTDKPVGFFSFVDTTHGFAYGGRNDTGPNNGLYLLRSNNGGITWDSTFIPDISVYNDQITITAVSFVDRLNGWFFGFTFYQGGLNTIIIRTSDGGNSWTRESIGLADEVGDAVMIDKYHGWAVTLDGKVLGYGLMTDVVEHIPDLPTGFVLKQNYPNPFNPTTVINYQLPTNGFVSLKVYDVLGKEVATLVNEYKEAGYYQTSFDATNLTSGVYFYKLVAGSHISVKKLLLLK